jgi:hypothetical protein
MRFLAVAAGIWLMHLAPDTSWAQEVSLISCSSVLSA